MVGCFLRAVHTQCTEYYWTLGPLGKNISERPGCAPASFLLSHYEKCLDQNSNRAENCPLRFPAFCAEFTVVNTPKSTGLEMSIDGG